MRILEKLPLLLQRAFVGKARLRLLASPEEFDSSQGL